MKVRPSPASCRALVRSRSHRRAAACCALTMLQSASMLLGDDAMAQTNACDLLKTALAERIEATGVRGYSLEAVPSGAPVPSDAKAIGNCEAGAYKVLYRRWGATQAAASGAASAGAAGVDPAGHGGQRTSRRGARPRLKTIGPGASRAHHGAAAGGPCAATGVGSGSDANPRARRCGGVDGRSADSDASGPIGTGARTACGGWCERGPGRPQRGTRRGQGATAAAAGSERRAYPTGATGGRVRGRRMAMDWRAGAVAYPRRCSGPGARTATPTTKPDCRGVPSSEPAPRPAARPSPTATRARADDRPSARLMSAAARRTASSGPRPAEPRQGRTG